jgi:D-alanyl-D-alanine carboxypeptidase
MAVALSIAVAAGAACGSSTSTGSSSKSLSSNTTSQLDQAIPQAMSQDNIPGAIVGVWSRNGNYVRAFGVSDTTTRSPMQQGFYMRIGSITKSFTVTALLQLVDQGRVSLDDPISKYLAGVPNGDQITIRQLAGMQSGLFSYTDDDGFQASVLAHPLQQWSIAQLLQIAFSHPPNFPPGTNFQYCNTNTVLLGLVVEKVTGQSLASYLQQRVLNPLHLDHTALPSGNELPNPHAQGYTQKGSPGQPRNATDWNPSWAGAAGAMYATLNDLHSWVPPLATGTLLKPSTQAQRLQFVPFKAGPPGSTYGLGMTNFSGWIGHGGNLSGYSSMALYLPSQRASLVILVNTESSNNPKLSPNTILGNVVTKIVSPGNVIGEGTDNET